MSEDDGEQQWNNTFRLHFVIGAIFERENEIRLYILMNWANG